MSLNTVVSPLNYGFALFCCLTAKVKTMISKNHFLIIFKYNGVMKIAIVKLSALGDIIHAASVLQFIKFHIPDARIDWIVEDAFSDILAHNKDINCIKRVNLKSIKSNYINVLKEIKNIKTFTKNSYDITIDLQGLLKSSIVSKIISKNVAGFDKNSVREKAASLFYKKKISVPYHENTIDRYRVLVSQALEIDIKKEDILDKKPYLSYAREDKETAHLFLAGQRKKIIFIIGSTWPSRIYPDKKLIYIANNINADIFIPYGSDSEKHTAEKIASLSKNVTVLPKMNLNQLKAVISNSDLVIGNDTGPTYIAWANNIPSVTLFGPTPPTRIYETSINKILKIATSLLKNKT